MAAAATSFEAAAQKLLNPNGDEFDVSLLDDVIAAAYSPSDPNRALANKALMALQETPNVWTKADAILERAQNPQSRFFGLQVLDDAIRTRYGDLYVCVYIYLFICNSNRGGSS
jgi:exportin-1